MSRKLAVLCMAAFAGCSPSRSDLPAKNAAGAGTAGISTLFANTTRQTEERLAESAAYALKAGFTLGSVSTERCWRQEAGRPAVQALCLLLWAGGAESSALLEEALAGAVRSSRLLAFAALMRKTTIHRMSPVQLLELLQLLAQDPLWARATAVSVWAEKNGIPDRELLERILPHLLTEEEASPRDLASSLLALFLVSPGSWQSMLARYCDPATAGEARLRCWRVIGALSEPAMSPGMKPELAAFLPSPADPDWRLFQRTFPLFSKRIRQHFPMEKQ